MRTRITELLGIEYPIIQGGMAWVAEYHLAAAVSNAGGLGLIGTASAPAEWVREQIREAKKLTDKPFGINIMMISPYRCRISGKIYKDVEGSRNQSDPCSCFCSDGEENAALWSRCSGGRRNRSRRTHR